MGDHTGRKTPLLTEDEVMDRLRPYRETKPTDVDFETYRPKSLERLRQDLLSELKDTEREVFRLRRDLRNGFAIIFLVVLICFFASSCSTQYATVAEAPRRAQVETGWMRIYTPHYEYQYRIVNDATVTRAECLERRLDGPWLFKPCTNQQILDYLERKLNQ